MYVAAYRVTSARGGRRSVRQAGASSRRGVFQPIDSNEIGLDVSSYVRLMKGNMILGL